MARSKILTVFACAVFLIPAGLHADGGYKGEVQASLDNLERKFVGLAEAMPQEKYSWRPREGVRSVSEVFMHVAAANYGIPNALGTPPPAEVDRRGLEKITDKAKVIETLKASFAHVKKAVEAVPDAQIADAIKLFGRDNTKRGAMLAMVGHTSEHLGQAIAYARSNGVKPPWSR